MLITLLTTLSFAVPVEMNHQGRLLDSDGTGLQGTQYLTIKIYDSETGGSVVYNESLIVDCDNGFYSTTVGVSGMLDSEVLEQYPLWLELTLGTNAPMTPRHSLGAVPYAVISEVAESVDGPVNATEITVNGTLVIDADGNWVGPAISGGSTSGGSTTGGSTSGGSTGGTNSPVYWSDILGRPLGLDDGDDYLSEGQVETYITNGFINLATGSRMGGYDLLTTNSTITPQWSNLQGIPSDIADGDQDTKLTESEVENYIINGAINLGSGSQAGGSPILTQNSSIPWSSLTNVPSGLSDGDDDTLSGLNCGSGDVVSWNGSAFECLTPQQTSVNGTVVNLSDGSTINGSPIVTEADLSTIDTTTNWSDIVDVPAGFLDGEDNDSFADISCGSGETISFDGTNWVCISSTVDFADLTNVPAGLEDGDDDTLAVLQCTDGQVAVYSSNDNGWICGDMSGGTSGELAKSNRIGESDGGFAYSNLDTAQPVDIPDNNTFGFTSTRYITEPNTITTMSIDLKITHQNMGEVTATLTSPSGTSIVIYDGDHEGQANFDGNIGWDYDFNQGNLYSFFSEGTVGTWTLNVTDNAGADADGNTLVGTLDGWTMRFNEDWDGDIFVGDNVTVQEEIVVRGELRLEYGADLVMTNTDGEETLRISPSDPGNVLMTNNIASKLYTNTNTTGNSTYVYCNTGDVMLGGGCNANSYTTDSRPEGQNGWYCYDRPQGNNITAYVRCLDITP